MASTSILRPVGNTICLSVVAVSHAAIPLTFATNDQVNFASCLNTGSLPVAIKFSVAGVAATFPAEGTPGDYVLPPLMEFPLILSIPSGAVEVTAIGAGAGPTPIYVTPVGDQS